MIASAPAGPAAVHKLGRSYAVSNGLVTIPGFDAVRQQADVLSFAAEDFQTSVPAIFGQGRVGTAVAATGWVDSTGAAVSLATLTAFALVLLGIEALFDDG